MNLANAPTHGPASTGRIAIIAGNGELPSHLLEELRNIGQTPVLIGIDDEIEPALIPSAQAVLTFGQVGKLVKILQQQNVKRLIFAGGVKKRPDFKKLKLDFQTLKELPEFLKIAMGGDNSVLAKIAGYFEKKNITIVGSHEIAPGLVTPAGLICGKFSKNSAMPIIQQAFHAAKTIGGMDVGQAAVAEDGRVIALEGLEGTDAMLQRVAGLRVDGRLTATPKFGVLAKAMKPDQDMRADLPAIGPKTIDGIVAAGLKGIVIEAGCSLILNRQKTLEKAKAGNIFIFGYNGKAA